jgi:hypothetical protein
MKVVFDTIAEKYFPKGGNKYLNIKLCDVDNFLATFTGE